MYAWINAKQIAKTSISIIALNPIHNSKYTCVDKEMKWNVFTTIYLFENFIFTFATI